MYHIFKIFLLLIWKCILVRKRNWLYTIIVEIIVPNFFFALGLSSFTIFQVFSGNHTNILTFPRHSISYLNSVLDKKYIYYYVPQNSFTEIIMEYTQVTCSIPSQNIIGFATEREMFERYADAESKDDIRTLIFENGMEGTTFKYTIGLSQIPIKITNQTTPSILSLGSLQACLDLSFIIKILKVDLSIKINVQKIPESSDEIPVNLVKRLREGIMGVTLLVFLIFVLIEVKFPADERLTGVSVMMSMNGVPMYLNLLSWFVCAMVLGIINITIMCLLCKLEIFSENSQSFFVYGDIGVLWLVLCVHLGHVLSFGMHISAYIPSYLWLGPCILAAYLTPFVFYVVTPINEKEWVTYIGLLFPNILLLRALEEFNVAESRSTGIQWHSLFEPENINHGVVGSAGMIIVFSMLGIIFNFILTLEAMSVFPGKYGVRNPPYTFFCRRCKDIHEEEEEFEALQSTREDLNRNLFERHASDYNPGIQLRNITKSYILNWFTRTKSKVLKGISIDFYEGQITALLGPNGAGKSTLMRILSGMTSPSGGSVYINGKNIESSGEVLQDVGHCPQENILFSNMTVFQQICFFCKLKGNYPPEDIKPRIHALLDLLNLYHKRKAYPHQLSKGQKRRLCFGMAIISNARILVLDEPSAGMDPEGKRDLWNILTQMRGEKTILLSTHDMEEADALGDRIAIMHAGNIRSYGSAAFLKTLVGGKNLQVSVSTEDRFRIDAVRTMLNPNANILETRPNTVVYSVPFTQNLPEILDRMDADKKSLGITSLNVSVITLEQVFIQATKDFMVLPEPLESFLEPEKYVTGWRLHFNKIFALMVKKYVFTRKNLLPSVFSSVLTSLAPMCIFRLLSLIDPGASPPQLVSLSMHVKPVTYFKTNDKEIGELYRTVASESGGDAIETKSDLNEIFSKLLIKDSSSYLSHTIAGVEFDKNAQGIVATAFYSSNVSISLPISMNLLSNAILKRFIGNNYSIRFSIQEVHNWLEDDDFSNYRTLKILPATTLHVFLFASVIFIIAALFVMHPAHENATTFKHLQRMTGISSLSYWGIMFILDCVVYLVTIGQIVFSLCWMDYIVLNFKIMTFHEIGIALLLLWLFLVNSLLIDYIVSFLKFKAHTLISGVTLASILSIAIDIILHLLFIMHSDSEYLNNFESIYIPVSSLIPYISFYRGEFCFFMIGQKNARCRRMPSYVQSAACQFNDSCCGYVCLNGSCNKLFAYFDTEDVAGNILYHSVLYLAAMPLLLVVIIGILESKFVIILFRKYTHRKKYLRLLQVGSQMSVSNEKRAVLHAIKQRNKNIRNEPDSIDYLFLAYELAKRYGKVLAVDDITFGVKYHECFGLLGANGAGKSTTFQMMTAHRIPDHGLMFLNEQEICKNPWKHLEEMSYCPQENAMLLTLNAKDHLKLFGLLRGIPRDKIDAEIDKWINVVNLESCASQACDIYSQGNKRRLSVAMALIGRSTIILMDEPTTGIDPVARRALWNIIKSFQAKDQAVVLTSHSMMECEALCERFGIMVNGAIQCIGTIPELKEQFHVGHDFQIRLNSQRSDAEVENIKLHVRKLLTCLLFDENRDFLFYHITDPKTTLKNIYDAMEVLKKTYKNIEDATVKSSTLEQLLTHFARPRNSEMFM